MAASAVQLIPLPRRALDLLSPSVATFLDAYRVDAGVAAAAPAPLSLDPRTTAYTLALVAGATLLFWSARALFTDGGVRLTARTIGLLGLVVSVVAVVQRAVAPGAVYGIWEPLEAGASPIGPVVNPNQFAAWLLMALPLTIGYLVAHIETHGMTRRARSWQSRLRRVADVRAMYLAAAAVVMGLVVVFSGSRSALAGLLVAAVFGWIVGRSRAGTGGRHVVLVLAFLVAAVVTAWLNLDPLVERFNRVDSGLAGRVTIWRDTLWVAGRFWLTGVGLGGYQTAMVVFQTTTREVFYNHAHSQYLQLAMEGGLLLTVPAVLALAALVAGARGALAADRSPVWSIRVGAASGLVAVAVESIWESVLRMPANGVLMAVAAAILLHRAADSPRD
jgi:O-antigen ligase